MNAGPPSSRFKPVRHETVQTVWILVVRSNQTVDVAKVGAEIVVALY